MKTLILSALILWLMALNPVSICSCQDRQQNIESLLDAAKCGDLQRVILLLREGADINGRGKYRYTPLIAAAKNDQVEIARLLCDKGADVNAVASPAEIEGESGYSPLIWAAHNCSESMAELLLARGADANRPGEEGDTPLMIAARSGCLDIVRLLIEKGAVANQTREYDRSTPLIEAVFNCHLEVADYLIRSGAPVEIKDYFGDNLLAVAARAGSLAEVRYLFEKGLEINGRSEAGLTPVFLSLGHTIERRYILEYLIEHGGDPSSKSRLGTTPLMQAAYDAIPWAVEFLIRRGAVVNDMDMNSETALHYACRGIPDEVGPGSSATESAEAIRFLLDKGANVNAKDNEGRTPLMIASRAGIPLIVGFLLNRRAQTNVQDKTGWSALMYAAEANRTEVIKVLVQNGADLKLKNSKGQTALSIAKEREASSKAYELLKSLETKVE
jgi:ankyrin repeat protein